MQKVVYDPENLGAFYSERVNRNIGWITPGEQAILRQSVVGIAGCGGMGGLLAATLIRLGIGEVRIADTEVFDISNINRQFAAFHSTIGKSKAEETARQLREITPDVRLVVYPEGIVSGTVGDFVSGCHLICDEIEFWAIGSRIMLHQVAQSQGVPLITCSSVGFGSRLFYFDHAGMDMAEMLGFTLSEAMYLQLEIQNNTINENDVQRVMKAVLSGLIPELPKYSEDGNSYDDKATCIKRLMQEQRASIIATNPPLASGFAANHALLSLLSSKGSARSIPSIPPTPGYIHLDAVKLIAKQVWRTRITDND